MRYLWLLMVVMIAPASVLAMETPQECQVIANHVPDHGVAYQPGVDVDGNPVTPADLGVPSPFGVPDVMVVPLSIDIAARLNDPPEDLVGEAPLGFLEIYPNGRMVYDGKEVASQVQTLCAQDWASVEPLPPQEKAVEYGQGEGNPLESEPVAETVEPAAAPPEPAPEPGELLQGGEGRDEGIE